MTIYFQPVQDVQISTQSSRSQYQYTLTGTDAAQVTLWAEQAGRRTAPRSAVPRRLVGSAGGRPARRARHQPPARRPARRQPAGRQRHAERCLRAAADFDHLRPGQPVSRGAGGAADVSARSRRSCRNSICPARAGAQVPLSAVATLTRTTAPLAISHQAQFPAVSLSFNLAPGAALGDAVEAVKTIETRIGMPAASSACSPAMPPNSPNRWPASRG